MLFEETDQEEAFRYRVVALTDDRDDSRPKER